MPHIQTIVRAIILSHHNVLLVRDRIEGHVYPPEGILNTAKARMTPSFERRPRNSAAG